MANNDALLALNRQLSGVRSRYALAAKAMGLVLVAGVLAFLFAIRENTASVACLGLLLLPVLAVALGGLRQELRTLKAGPVPKARVPMVVSIDGGLLRVSRLGVHVSLPMSEIKNAEYVFPAVYSGAHWLEAVLLLNAGSSQLTVPESATGFHELLQWLDDHREVKRREIE